MVTATSFAPTGETALLSPDDLDQLRGDLLGSRDTWSAQLAQYEERLTSAPPDPFGAAIRELATRSIGHIRDAIADIDHMLAGLVQIYGSCEWCDMVVPMERLQAIPLTRLCSNCEGRALGRAPRRGTSRAVPVGSGSRGRRR